MTPPSISSESRRALIAAGYRQDERGRWQPGAQRQASTDQTVPKRA